MKILISVAVLAVFVLTVPAQAFAYGGGGGMGVSGLYGPKKTQSPTGEVLGAESFNFQNNLAYNSTGNDVVELQKFLISKGYLKISAPTGWFGPLTTAAVKEYQASKGIIQTGYVGPLTREALNNEMVSPVSTLSPGAQVFKKIGEKISEVASDVADSVSSFI